MAEKRRRRGFAALDEATRKRTASMGRQIAHAKGVAHRYTAEEARLAGRKGGQAVSRDRAHMAAIGRKGGLVPRHKQKRPR
jgi:general stress protein YciG